MLRARATFCGLPFTLAPGRVFTPRLATERLVRAALARIDGGPKRVADAGTGSGAIAVALAVYRPQIEVWATDASRDAVELARHNAAENGVADRVHVLRGDLLEPIPVQLDVVVANLPYLPESLRDPRYDTEPDEAVYALGRDGLDPVRRLLDECREGMLAAGGVVLIQLYGNVLAANRPHLEDAA
jgi:release factor glutamine methyltransferase